MCRCCISIAFQFLLTLGICTGLSAQQVITHVEFTGLTKTNESFLRQYITTSAGQTYDSTQLANDRQRLLNLRILGEVEMKLTTEESNVKVIFACREMINTLPVMTTIKMPD
ncbi:MAG: POTRA domain-containing protein [Cyclobacteriaceae bacterium]